MGRVGRQLNLSFLLEAWTSMSLTNYPQLEVYEQKQPPGSLWVWAVSTPCTSPRVSVPLRFPVCPPAMLTSSLVPR